MIEHILCKISVLKAEQPSPTCQHFTMIILDLPFTQINQPFPSPAPPSCHQKTPPGGQEVNCEKTIPVALDIAPHELKEVSNEKEQSLGSALVPRATLGPWVGGDDRPVMWKQTWKYHSPSRHHWFQHIRMI